MKTIYQMYEDVKRIEVQQLRNKLHNWNDEFHFGDYTSEEQPMKAEAPIVAASCYDEPTDVVIDAVIKLADDSIQIKCHDKNNPHEELILDENNVYYGHLDFLTGSIPNRYADYNSDKLYSLFMGTIFNSDTNRYESGDYWMNQDEYEALERLIKD